MKMGNFEAKTRASSNRARRGLPFRGLAAWALTGLVGAALLAGPLTGRAAATWSILIADTRTGEIVLGSATCLTGFDLRAGTPVIVTGVGAATAQSFVDSTGQNRVFIRDGLLAGTDPDQILAGLATFDTGHQTRQYGIVDTAGRAATFSGTSAGNWAGGVTGQAGDLVYAVQGNLLTGPNVVDDAVDALLTTEGDLPAKLMAAMEAARAAGGDGRCSCPGSNPTGCGSPPPSFEKSSHIAYVMGARAGDTDACTTIQRVEPGTPRDLALADATGNGRPDALVVTGSGVHVYASTGGGPFVTFEGPVQTVPVPSAAQSIAMGDLTGDGLADLVTANRTAFTVSVARALPGGGFGTVSTRVVGARPDRLALGDFNGNGLVDVATSNRADSSVSIMRSDGQGGLGAPQVITLPGEPMDIASADLTGNGVLDLVVALQSRDSVLVLTNDGDGQFSLGAELSTGARPGAVFAGDLTGDGQAEIASANAQAQTVTVYRRTLPGWQSTEFGVDRAPRGFAAADLTGDGRTELGVLIAGGVGGQEAEFVIVNIGPDGQAEVGASHPISLAQSLAFADMNQNGWVDAVGVSSTRGLIASANLGEGVFASWPGCGQGEHFMNFNVAFVSSLDPDPVFTIRDEFDAWRADLEGEPDAVRSTAEFKPDRLFGDGESAGAMRIELRDWRGETATAQELIVRHAAGSDGRSEIGAVEDLGGGVFEVTLAAGLEPGVDRFEVVAIGDGRPVTLMPEPRVRTIFGNADWNGDGEVDVNDFFAFLASFEAGEPRADLTGSLDPGSPEYGVPDGEIDVMDFFYFLDVFAGAG